QVVRLEWVWGLPRGGLSQYVQSKANEICLPAYATEMLHRGDFVLVPTFQAFKEAMSFMRAQDPAKNLTIPRRPLTAASLHPANEPHCYFFVPLTEAGRQLAHTLPMLRYQTLEDRNLGIHPVTNEVLISRIHAYPVLETPAHPASMGFFTWRTLEDARPDVAGPGLRERVSDPEMLIACLLCLLSFFKSWGIGSDADAGAPPPWFAEADAQAWDPHTIYPFEAPSADCVDRAPAAGCADPELRAFVLKWLEGVDPVAAPEVGKDPARLPDLIRRVSVKSVSTSLVSVKSVSTSLVSAGDLISSPCRKVFKSVFKGSR
ncbi:hypothetical protein HDZ31DRAFT_50860, partial [Schizophyllum fasciatum]